MHRFYLLLAAQFGLLHSLIFLLNSLNFTFYFFLPLVLQVYLPLLVDLFEFTDFLEFGLFLDLQQRLFYSFCQEHVQDWLNLSIIVE